ncbi:MAG: hypothetical protein GY909_09365 [Oligoflexia bacterium]|nr:hypothetical protein [Oligoflexia bacterium]
MRGSDSARILKEDCAQKASKSSCEETYISGHWNVEDKTFICQWSNKVTQAPNKCEVDPVHYDSAIYKGKVDCSQAKPEHCLGVYGCRKVGNNSSEETNDNVVIGNTELDGCEFSFDRQRIFCPNATYKITKDVSEVSRRFQKPNDEQDDYIFLNYNSENK